MKTETVTQYIIKFYNIKFHDNLSNGSRVYSCIRHMERLMDRVKEQVLCRVVYSSKNGVQTSHKLDNWEYTVYIITKVHL